MRIRKITSEQIADSGVELSIPKHKVDDWRVQAELAATIANDKKFQRMESMLLDLIEAREIKTDAIGELTQKKSDFVVGKYGHLRYYDSSVSQAANMAAARAIMQSRGIN